MVVFIHEFFKLIYSRQHESDHKRANEFLNVPSTTPNFLTEEENNQYRDILSKPVFEKFVDEIKFYPSVKWINQNIVKIEYSFLFDGLEINVDPLQCGCAFWSSMMLPCRHIIAVRKLNNLNLFDLTLINERWTVGMKRK